jgi:crotonobetainyl-CoA:carnitine CoA-transferase CaiB-like acyl-CoA transferase
MLLAGMGAEVIVVEPPSGHPLRHLPPHAPGVEPPESGLWFAAFANGKRSVVLDATQEHGVAQLRALLATADIVVEDAGVGHYDALGLGRDALAGENPGLIWVSVTPFGLSGPKRDWHGSDLVAWASSGVLYTVGFPDRAPVAPAGQVQLTQHLASLNAAIAALLGLRARRRNGGRGQLADISVAESCLWIAAETAPPVFLDDLVHRTRPGNRRPLTSPFGLYPCADGFVSFLVLQPAHWQAMSAWMHECTGNEAVLDPVFADIRVRYEAMEAIGEWTEDLTRQFTKLHIFEEGQRRGIPVTPVNTIADLRADPHLAATGFWRAQEHPVLGKLSSPREPFRTSPDFWRLSRAPLLGEHTEALLG